MLQKSHFRALGSIGKPDLASTGPTSEGRHPSSPRECRGCALVWVALGLLLGFRLAAPCHGSETEDAARPLSGKFALHAQVLRMQHVQLRLPGPTLVDYSGKGEPDAPDWHVTLRRETVRPDLWHLSLEQTTDVVRRSVEYVLSASRTNSGTDTLIPLIATEIAVDLDSGTLLYRSQTLEWTIEAQGQQLENGVDMALASAWILDHLRQVYNTEILDLCIDYFGHYPDPRGFDRGFGGSVDCIKRRIELDPREPESYTLAAWLLWSDWVSWSMDPNDIPDSRDNVDQAVMMIKRGRAANPDSAAYHLDAAQTLEPLARHHRPDLMPFVIRYYHYAENLATGTPLKIRARLSLGHQYRQQGDIEKAIRWYRAVLELDPENKVARRYLDKLIVVAGSEDSKGRGRHGETT